MLLDASSAAHPTYTNKYLFILFGLSLNILPYASPRLLPSFRCLQRSLHPFLDRSEHCQALDLGLVSATATWHLKSNHSIHLLGWSPSEQGRSRSLPSSVTWCGEQVVKRKKRSALIPKATAGSRQVPINRNITRAQGKVLREPEKV